MPLKFRSDRQTLESENTVVRNTFAADNQIGPSVMVEVGRNRPAPESDGQIVEETGMIVMHDRHLWFRPVLRKARQEDERSTDNGKECGTFHFAGRNINNFRYPDDTTLTEKSEEGLLS